MSKFKRIINKFRYGLILQVIKDLLAKIGINIVPFYWIQEGFANESQVTLPSDLESYTFEFFNLQDINMIGNIPGRGYDEQDLRQRLKEGKMCYGMKFKGKIAAFNWIDCEGCHFKGHQQKLNNHEAYLFDMYTLKSFRGQNLAPVLRLRTHQALNEMGKNKLYSVSETTNPPSIKFKQKINSRFLKLILFIELFQKFQLRWTIRK